MIIRDHHTLKDIPEHVRFAFLLALPSKYRYKAIDNVSIGNDIDHLSGIYRSDLCTDLLFVLSISFPWYSSNEGATFWNMAYAVIQGSPNLDMNYKEALERARYNLERDNMSSRLAKYLIPIEDTKPSESNIINPYTRKKRKLC